MSNDDSKKNIIMNNMDVALRNIDVYDLFGRLMF